MATAAEIKTAMKTLLSGGDAWIKGATARDENGLPVPALSERAVSWDLYGALIVATKDETDFTLRNEVYTELMGEIPSDFINRDIESYNDASAWSVINGLL